MTTSEKLAVSESLLQCFLIALEKIRKDTTTIVQLFNEILNEGSNKPQVAR